MKPQTARLAMSNLLPAGVRYPVAGGFGAGASGRDAGRRESQRRSLLTQFMPGAGPSGDAVASRGELNAAIDADLRE